MLARVSWLAADFFKEFEQEEEQGAEGTAEVDQQDVAPGQQRGGGEPPSGGGGGGHLAPGQQQGGGGGEGSHATGQRGQRRGAPASAGIPDADLYVLTRILHDW